MGKDWTGGDRSGREGSGSSFRSRRNVAAGLPKEGRGRDGMGGEWIGVDTIKAR